MPKPANVAGALQPLFEAVSNAIHSTQDAFEERVADCGRVIIQVETNRSKDGVMITVEDNGVGLDEKNWEAFQTTDTEAKIKKGGKGVGRLMWLDCFETIDVRSVYVAQDGACRERKFTFSRSSGDEIQDYSHKEILNAHAAGMWVKFAGLRDNGYREKFPGRNSYIFRHFTSHFLPTLIGGRSPNISITVGNESEVYPDAISKIIIRREPVHRSDTEPYGTLEVVTMECHKTASMDLDGKHYVHFIAHDRTVHSQCIDKSLGLKYFGDDQSSVLHAIVTGEFLDNHVNQERTGFLFSDDTIEAIVGSVCMPEIRAVLKGPLAEVKQEQLGIIELIAETYPSVAFGNIDELQERVPLGELNNDAIYGHLARERFRRDQKQTKKIRDVLKHLKAGVASAEDFFSSVRDAGKAIEDTERRSLAEYVVRRKVVLDFMDLLLRNVGSETSDKAYQRERLLHSFICPMRTIGVDGGGSKLEATSHDLWIIDERLTFAQYFGSDAKLSELSEASGSDDRPDVVIFDHVHGLRQSEESSKVLLVEFKRPGRTDYQDRENPQFQVERYTKQLQSGQMRDFNGRPITLDKSTVFYCFIVADIIGKIDDWTDSWQRTADGRGRIYTPRGGFVGSIELVGWNELIRDARERNKAFFDRLGMSGKSFFCADE